MRQIRPPWSIANPVQKPKITIAMKLLFLCVALVLLMNNIQLQAGAQAKDAFPPVDELPSIRDLPDPFVFYDGSKVKSAEDWSRRRAELKALIQYYEYGHLPPAPGNVKATEIATQTLPNLPATEKRFKLEMGPNQQVSIHLDLTIPEGAGPFPVIIRGDLGWGKVKPEIMAAVIKRGYILAEFDRTDLANDK